MNVGPILHELEDYPAVLRNDLNQWRLFWDRTQEATGILRVLCGLDTARRIFGD